MSKTYLFARKIGIGGTAILETTIRDAVDIMRKNRNVDFQLGILSGSSYDSIKKVYSEYAPYKKVSTVDELLQSVKK